ncbi:hypothetical protein Psed_4481 [Pseudonocardia dioxanivorans CB1190]|uniref:DUF4190 domain-containing protein n=1 Tax=Pseudonocardia dioxanivorans (strain ATCC 55486 / DSM 44775 / JCM 13855 / CB1190) TaxID=675635 RepID=F4CYR6_PSEUX|nr:DUF4190 domain-containing protein [Pseudonocardia dioxanivorans]AEA26636.1 hypothetical protein Psed_4481 [Pseudonocardia dioxanivorans CB1190]
MSQDQSGNDPTAASRDAHGSPAQDPTATPWGTTGDPVSFEKKASHDDATTSIPGPGPTPGWDPNAYQNPYGQNPYGQNPYGQDPYGGPGSAQPGYGAPQQGWDPNAYPPPGYAQQYSGYDQQAAYGAYPAYQQPAYPVQPPTNTMAILSLIFAFVFPVLGLVFGFVAKSQIRSSGESGDGLAMAGIIISVVFIALFVLFFVFIFGIIGAAASSVPYN